MHITFTEAAARKLAPHLVDGAMLKLFYDTQGCGCGMSGVPALQLVEEIVAHDKRAEGDPFPFLYEQWYEVFFEPRLKIDYRAVDDSFSLRSDSGIYTTHLRFIKLAAAR